MKEKLIKYIKIFLIILILEVIVFNFNSYRTFFGNYTVKEFKPEELQYIDVEEDSARILIDNINVPVATIRLELSSIIENVEYSYSYSDETTDGYMGLPNKEYVGENINTHYIPCYLSGKVDSLILNTDKIVKEYELIEKIVVNEKIPFDFNFIRVILLMLVVAIFDFFKNSKILNTNYQVENLKQEVVLLSVLGIFALLVTFININANAEELFDMYNKGLVDALYNKQLHLLQEPSEEFKALKNPYDRIIRGQADIERDVDYVWDSAYYNEKFYVYFGILPVLIFFLPFFLLTGEYLQCAIVCLAISIGVLVLLKEILCQFYKRYFSNVPFNLVVFSLMTLYAGSIIFYMNGAARFYEVPILSGVFCVLLGIFFVFKSMEQPAKKYRYIFLTCLFMALSVACRPTNVLSSLLIVPYLWQEFFGGIKHFKEKKKPLFQCVFAIVIPYLMIAIPLMWYNYVRFGSILEFGSNYQITINNIKVLDNRIFAIPVGLVCNLFSIPNFIPEFPFIQNHNELSTFYGFYYIENMIGGLFILAPICFLCFYVHKVHKKTDSKELRNWIYVLIITGILIAAISAAMGGSIQRYLFDYAWMFVLAGILIFTTIYQSLKTEEAKKILIKILCILTIYIVIINFLGGIVSEKSFFEIFSLEIFYKMKYSICFWK